MRVLPIALPVTPALVVNYAQAVPVTARKKLWIAVTHDRSPDRENDDCAAILKFFAYLGVEVTHEKVTSAIPSRKETVMLACSWSPWLLL